MYLYDAFRSTGPASVIDRFHTLSYFAWIIGNVLWACGDLFFAEDQWVAPLLHRPSCPPVDCRPDSGQAWGLCVAGEKEIFSGLGIPSQGIPAGVDWPTYAAQCPIPNHVEHLLPPGHHSFCETSCVLWLNGRWLASWFMVVSVLISALLYIFWGMATVTARTQSTETDYVEASELAPLEAESGVLESVRALLMEGRAGWGEDHDQGQGQDVGAGEAKEGDLDDGDGSRLVPGEA